MGWTVLSLTSLNIYPLFLSGSNNASPGIFSKSTLSQFPSYPLVLLSLHFIIIITKQIFLGEVAHLHVCWTHKCTILGGAAEILNSFHTVEYRVYVCKHWAKISSTHWALNPFCDPFFISLSHTSKIDCISLFPSPCLFLLLLSNASPSLLIVCRCNESNIRFLSFLFFSPNSLLAHYAKKRDFVLFSQRAGSVPHRAFQP